MAMIDRNFDFATNGTVSAAALHNLIDSATIYQYLITGQQPITSVGTNYKLLIADGTNANAAPNAVTVYDLFEDALTAGTYSNANISEALSYGTATGTRLVSTNATITTGTIATLNSTTGTIATLNSTTGTIGNLTTTLAGDFTISAGTSTLGTTGVAAGTYGASTIIPVIAVDAKGRVTSMGTSAVSAGKVLQVLSTIKTDTASLDSSTFGDISGLSVSITPSSSSSKILVSAVIHAVAVGVNTNPYLRLLRGSTDIAQGDAAGSRVRVTSTTYTELFAPATIIFLDSPSTTSSVTYKIQWASSANGYTIVLNRSGSDTDSADRARSISTITVMEVAA